MTVMLHKYIYFVDNPHDYFPVTENRTADCGVGGRWAHILGLPRHLVGDFPTSFIACESGVFFHYSFVATPLAAAHLKR
jgi:hypothetical protein